MVSSNAACETPRFNPATRPPSGSALHSDGATTVGREIHEIPEDFAARILAVTGAPETAGAATRIESHDLARVSAIVGTRLDSCARHWLYEAIA